MVAAVALVALPVSMIALAAYCVACAHNLFSKAVVLETHINGPGRTAVIPLKILGALLFGVAASVLVWGAWKSYNSIARDLVAQPSEHQQSGLPSPT